MEQQPSNCEFFFECTMLGCEEIYKRLHQRYKKKVSTKNILAIFELTRLYRFIWTLKNTMNFCAIQILRIFSQPLRVRRLYICVDQARLCCSQTRSSPSLGSTTNAPSCANLRKKSAKKTTAALRRVS